MKSNRAAGLVLIAAVYTAAALLGIAVFLAYPCNPIVWRILAGNLVATLFVYLIGVLLKNASVYDPYWSVAPIVILTGIALYTNGMTPGAGLLLLAVWYWGARLTGSWALAFRNLTVQDWRYDSFLRRYPRLYPVISLFGIHLFPTLVVYLCLLPGVVFMQGSACKGLTAAGFAVCVSAATLQWIADEQMRRFRRENSGKNLLIRTGLWKYSRHPNYLGEILMWWGVYLIMLSAAPGRWYLGVGPLANTLMFLFVSIPMADKRNREKRPGFEEYRRETNSLLPFRIS